MTREWRCFFCDEVFTDRRAAWAHFGESFCESAPLACIDPLRTDEKARLTELREAREHARKMQAESEKNDEAEALLQNFRDDLQRYFGKDCSSVWLAGDRYQSALNRVHDLESESLDAVIDNIICYLAHGNPRQGTKYKIRLR